MQNSLIAKNVVSGASTTTVAKIGAGFLGSIIINTPVASGTYTIYDNSSAAGLKIATALLPATVGVPTTIIYNCNFSVGLTIVSTITGLDYTVTYV